MTDIAIAHKDAYQASAQIAEQPVIASPSILTGIFIPLAYSSLRESLSSNGVISDTSR